MSSRITSTFGTLSERTHPTGPEITDEEMTQPTTVDAPGAADDLVGDGDDLVGDGDEGVETDASVIVDHLSQWARVQRPVHVWVDGDFAGLLLAWSQGPDQMTWWGRVFWCPPDVSDCVLDWIPQNRLQPAR